MTNILENILYMSFRYITSILHRITDFILEEILMEILMGILVEIMVGITLGIIGS